MAQSTRATIDWEERFGGDFDESQCKVMKHFIEIYTPTAEDIAHQFSQQEEMELCRRVKCRVLISRWNPVSDYKARFMREGRLQNKNTKRANALLAKAVNQHKQQALYTDEEIQARRDEEWRQRKKDNILRLRLWANDRKKACQEKQAETFTEEDVNDIADQEMEEEHLVEEDLEADESFVDVSSVVGEEFLTYSESQQQQHLNKDGNNNSEVRLIAAAPATTSAAADVLPAAVMPFTDLNTESLTLGSQSESPRQSESLTYSMPTEYDDFTMRLPLTSTQSQ